MSPEEGATLIIKIAMLSWGNLTLQSQDNLIDARRILLDELNKPDKEEEKK